MLRKLRDQIYPPDSGYMEWKDVLASEPGKWTDGRRAASGPHVLLGTTIGRFKWEINFDSALAVALTLRGAQVHLLVCDHQLPACSPWLRHDVPGVFDPDRHHPRALLCDGCLAPSLEVLKPLGLPVHRYGDLLRPDDGADLLARLEEQSLAEIRALTIDGVAVGEHAVAGAIRFFACARLEDQPEHLAVTRRYARAAVRTTYATRRILERYPFEVACGSHGIYVPQGLVFEVARKRNVRVVNWHQAYRQRCVLFSHGDTYHKTLLDEPVADWRPAHWDAALERETMAYLDDRQYGKQDWISFNRDPEARSIEAVAAMGVNFNKPVVGLLTNVAWDAQLHYGATPFPDMMTWLLDTIRYFAKRPELQLLVRIHPAEVKGYNRSRQPALAEIHREFPTLPSNVFVIPPESSISTYSTMEQCNAVIIYATKTGIELAARGIPVVVAGEAWIKNKGFALDASSQDRYYELLDRLPLAGRLTPEQTTLARKYAYHFFMRRMIEIKYLDDKMRPQVGSLRELERGSDRGMDIVCDGILTGSKFVAC